MNPSQESQTEALEYLESQVARKRLFPRAIAVGLLSGAVAAAFRRALELGETGRNTLLRTLHVSPWAGALLLAVLALVGTRIALAIGNLDKDSGGSGIPHMKAVLEGHSKPTWLRLIPVKFLAAVSAITSGLALGREGPTVQMGGAIGFGLADLAHTNRREQRALTAAGAGSGLAAAFNAPLAGVTFVLEELQRDFQPVVFAAALLSATLATVVSRTFAGQVPVFSVPTISPPPIGALPFFILIGTIAGCFGILFNKGLLAASAWLASVRRISPMLVSLIAGVATGLAYLISPSSLGGGHGLTEAALHGQILLMPAIIILFTRLVFVHISYGTGVPGGIFAPLLSLGALLGSIIYQLSAHLYPEGAAAMAVAGMCALFSGVVRAPLTGIILIAEMTGSYDLLLPLLTSAFTAYAVAEAFRDKPIYEALLQRDAAAKQWNLEDGELQMVEFEVKEGSPFEGRTIRNLGLSEGTLIVLVRNQGRDSVPRADTKLMSPMRLVVTCSTPNGLHEMEQGTQSAIK